MEQKEGGFEGWGESGMIVVETVLSFTVFLVTIFSIAYFINILILHNKVQFAINSAAHELAGYTYLYAAFGGRDASQALATDNAGNTAMIDHTASSAYSSYQKVVSATGSVQSAAGQTVGFLTQLQGFGETEDDSDNGVDLEHLAQQLESLGNAATQTGQAIQGAAGEIKDAGEQVQDTVNQVRGLLQNKEGMISGLAYIALEGAEYGAKNLMGTGAACLLTKGYLKQGSLGADDFLRAYGVKDGYGGLDFSGSTIFCDSDFRMIDIVVEYDVEPGFVRLILPDGKFHMVNRVTIPAWLDGDGVKVNPGS
ncbi:MAG: hypothetical protein NC121_19910 [Blautia sp.]|nr:hypothetical protein [Blautia sp.]